jgi:hypothetical protein
MKTYQIYLYLLMLAPLGNSLSGQFTPYEPAGEPEYTACQGQEPGASCLFAYDRVECPQCPPEVQVGTCKVHEGVFAIARTGKKVKNPTLCTPQWEFNE